MKNKLKTFIKMVLPPLVLKIIKAMRLFAKRANKTDRLSSFKPSNTDRLIIMGNGPSLSTSFEKYQSEIVHNPLMAVNYFATSDFYTIVKPNYYMLVDSAFFYDSKEISQAIRNNIEALIRSFNELTTWKMIVFFPEVARGSDLIKRIVNPNIHILYFSYESIDENLFNEDERCFFYSHDLALVPSQNVLNTCIGIGIYYKFREIVLIGADTSGHEQYSIDQETNELIIVDQHFYGQEIRHMYKDPSQKTYLTGTEAFTAMANVLNNYDFYKRYAEKRDVVIYNASEYSWIDSYDRKKLDSLK